MQKLYQELVVYEMIRILNEISRQEAILLNMGINTPHILMESVRRRLLELQKNLHKISVEALNRNGFGKEQRELLLHIESYAREEAIKWKNSL